MGTTKEALLRQIEAVEQRHSGDLIRLMQLSKLRGRIDDELSKHGCLPPTEIGHELVTTLPAESIWVHADTLRVEQIVVNLLTNAAKYTDEGGHIGLTVQQEEDEAVLRVRDSGVGISAELLPHIFDLFTQVDKSLARSKGGLGIGLTIVKRIAEIHGGSVDVYSEGLGHGSEFIVRFPVALPPSSRESAPPKSAETTKDSRNLRILVVDDNHDSADTVAMLLRNLGHEVSVAYSGREALEQAPEFLPNIVVLDLGLPEMDGYEIARRLRQNPQLEHSRFIALSGYGQESDRERSRNEGFNAHLVKPVSFEKIEEVLRRISS